MSYFYHDTGEAANAAASIQANRKAGRCISIRDLAFSYAGGAVTGSLTITGSSSGYTWSVDVVAAGHVVIPFNGDGLKFPTQDDVTITLVAGGAGVTGKLNAVIDWTLPD